MKFFNFLRGLQTSNKYELHDELNGVASQLLVNLFYEIQSFPNDDFILSVVPRFDQGLDKEIIDIRFLDIDGKAYALIITEDNDYLLLKCIVEYTGLDDYAIEVERFQLTNEFHEDHTPILNHLRHLSTIETISKQMNLTDVETTEIEEDLS
jgi:hypothetical protein